MTLLNFFECPHSYGNGNASNLLENILQKDKADALLMIYAVNELETDARQRRAAASSLKKESLCGGKRSPGQGICFIQR